MSKNERETGKLNKAFLWGVAVAGVAGIVASLVRQKKPYTAKDRALELEKRTTQRLVLIQEKIKSLKEEYKQTLFFQRKERRQLASLIKQAEEEQRSIEQSRNFSIAARLNIEEVEERLILLEHGLTDEVTNTSEAEEKTH